MSKLKLRKSLSILPVFAFLTGFAVLVPTTPSLAESDAHDHHDSHDEPEAHADHDDHDHEHREAGAHQHGVAEIGAALDGGKLAIEFKSPAANLVGFEHDPKNDDQRKAVENAVIVLKNGKTLFVPDANAKCVLSAATVSSPFESDTADRDHDQDAHDHEKHDHDEAHENHEETHSDFSARYLFDCAAPQQLTTLRVGLFDIFPAIEKIDAVYLGDSVQLGAELTRTSADFSLSAQ